MSADRFERPERGPGVKGYPLGRLFPNVITLIGLCSGLTSIKCSFAGKWEIAMILIITACVIDAMDGRIARFMRATSDFGAQLDSLADFLNFGVAPSILLYFWYLKNFRFVGWILVMLFVICMALRLARFNVAMVKKEGPPINRKFFVGLPAPIGAIAALMPLMISLNGNLDFVFDEYFGKVGISVHLLLISFLVISRVPTFSAKHINIPSKFASILMLCLVLMVIFAITDPWVTFPILTTCYLCSIPVSAFLYYRSLSPPSSRP